MSNWPKLSLGEIFGIARGGSPRPIQDYMTDDPDGVNWIMIGDASSSAKHIRTTKNKIKPAGVKRSRMVHPGDFLLTNSMSFGRPYIMATSGCIHDGWLVLSPKGGDFDPDFFYHLLGSPVVYHQFQRLAGGAVVKNLNIELVSGVVVPVPPLAEQRRIAAILDKADALRRKAQQALDLTDDLIRSTFLDMFGDPVTNPKGWPTTPLGKCGDFQSGGTPSKARPDYWDGTIPWVSAKDMKREYIEDSQDHISDAAFEGTSIKMVPPESLLIVVRGMILAHTLPVALSRRPVTINQDMKAILPGEGHNPEFLFRNLQALAPYLLSRMSTAAHGTKRLEMEVLTSTEMLRPPKDLQIEFAGISAKIQETRLRNTRSLCVAGDLFEATLQRAFTGGL